MLHHVVHSFHPASAPGGAARMSRTHREDAAPLWSRLEAICPHDHRDVLRLIRAGHRAGEVAVALGMAPAEERRILADLARRLGDGS